ncbi:MAG: nuclear transport factor 2 family protein [Bacteroidota bacterium]|nr:nuclear transport factor 2 family protein [Bacteroidota bacterium]
MKQPEEILQQWISSVNSRDIKEILSFYDTKAVLIPTFSNRILDTSEKISNYFKTLASKEQLKVSLRENTVRIQKINGTISSVCGIYLWTMAVEGEILNFEARFSFLFDSSLPSPVLQHHSSQIPRTL